MPPIERMRMFRALALVVGAFVLLVQAAQAQGATPTAVVYRYEHAWGQQDVDAATAEFADDAVITLHDARTRLLAGPDQIHEFLQGAGLHAPPVLISTPRVDGETVTWSERTEHAGQVLTGSDLTVQAVVHDGKIQSMVYRPGTLVHSDTARTTAEFNLESVLMVPGSLLLFCLGLLSLATARPRVHSGSNLRGRLLRDLHRWRTQG
ncbi:MAG TPA: nuclear transport factor 2 family protein [Chloroflexota bacterium]